MKRQLSYFKLTNLATLTVLATFHIGDMNIGFLMFKRFI